MNDGSKEYLANYSWSFLEYKLTFKSTFEYFADPDPSDPDGDSDDDGLNDTEEYEMSNDLDGQLTGRFTIYL